MLPRTLLLRLSLALVGSLLGCAGDTTPPGTTADAAPAPTESAPVTEPAPSGVGTSGAAPAAPVAGAPSMTDGHFTQATFYMGPCVGGRGGCYSMDFQPDGTVKTFLLDAPSSGTYRIEGTRLLFSPRKGLPTDADIEITYVTTDDFKTFSQEGAPADGSTLYRRANR